MLAEVDSLLARMMELGDDATRHVADRRAAAAAAASALLPQIRALHGLGWPPPQQEQQAVATHEAPTGIYACGGGIAAGWRRVSACVA
jgi:hypothetical protein